VRGIVGVREGRRMARVPLSVYARQAGDPVRPTALSARFSGRLAFAAMLATIPFDLQRGVVDMEAAL
jgi:hypothetical protein